MATKQQQPPEEDKEEKVLYPKRGSSRHFNALLAFSNFALIRVALYLYLGHRYLLLSIVALHWLVSVLHHLAQRQHHMSGLAWLAPVARQLDQLDVVLWVLVSAWFLALGQQYHMGPQRHAWMLAGGALVCAVLARRPAWGTRSYVFLHAISHFLAHSSMAEVLEYIPKSKGML